ncbi:MAG: diguanylate cyclase [Idiomarina sp.]|nr:diguanylate cyclase [Idiomarina sp.]
MSSKELVASSNNGEIKTLLDFINRLGNASRGISREIDHKLSKIKSLTDSGMHNIDEYKPLFNGVTSALTREHSRLEKELAHSHLLASQASHSLLEYDQLARADKDQLRELMQRVDAPLYSYSELLPIMVEVIQLYRDELTLSFSKESHTSQICSVTKLNALQAELSNLLATVDFQGHASNALTALRQRMMGQLDAEQLMGCCVESLQLIIRGINEERQSAQQFLLSLSDALDSVGKALTRTIESHEEHAGERCELTNKLRQQVTTLSAAVQQSTDLQALKQQVHQHIVGISETLASKLEIEANEHQRLRSQLLSMQSRLEDVESEAQMYKRKLSEQKFKSLQDSLTRLPNRAAFEERLQLEYQRWQSYAAPLSIAIADIDTFKVINDTYGHIAGDKTLQVIANMLKKSLRETDFVCRYGGEEFVIIFPQTTTEVALELLEKARQRVKSIPFKFKNKSISITISAGVSSFAANDSPTRVFERADRALYQAKDSGRDRVCQY